MKIQTYYIIGTTCSGKSIFIQQSVALLQPQAAVVSVGDEMRRRYPDMAKFQGKGALESTEDEAFDIYCQQYDAAIAACGNGPDGYIFVDGQPRMISQIDRILNSVPGGIRSIIWLWESEEEIRSRIAERFPEPDQTAKRELSYSRIDNDRIQLFDVLHSLLVRAWIPIRAVHHCSNFNYARFWGKLEGD